MASVPQKLQDESFYHLLPHHDNNPSEQVKNLKQKRMQEHTKKPALVNKKSRELPRTFCWLHGSIDTPSVPCVFFLFLNIF
jgi:hypothetical protein